MPSTALPARPVALQRVVRVVPSDRARPVQQTIDGLHWTHWPEAEPFLRALPAGAWTEPLRQGWERVKHNPRREVWRATIRGRAYYLKYFYHGRRLSRWFGWLRKTACRAEWEGGLYTQAAGIAAARPLAYTEHVERGTRTARLLITEAIEPAEPLCDFWERLQSDQDAVRCRRDTAQLTEQLGELIARAHQAGFEHLDMHAANILVQTTSPRQYRVAFIDLQSARRGVPLRAHAVVRNLAQLNQWFRKHSSAGHRLRFLRAYMLWRNEFETSSEYGRPLDMNFRKLVTALDRMARRHADRLGGQRYRRIRRNGRYFARLRLKAGWRGVAMLSCKHLSAESRASAMQFHAHWWRQQFDPPLHWFDESASQSCKESHSAQVRRAVLQCGETAVPVIVKRPLPRNWRRWLARLCPPSRSRRGWNVGHALLHRDVLTARPLAMLERRIGPLVLDSLLMTEAVPGAADLDSFVRNEAGRRSPRAWARLKRELAPALARSLRRLHEAGFEHHDCKASNVLVLPYPHLCLLWIDLDGIRPAGRRAATYQLRALARLHVSLLDEPGLTRTDRVRFLKAYLARYGAPVDGWRQLWPVLARLVDRKSRAKAARREWKLKHYGRE